MQSMLSYNPGLISLSTDDRYQRRGEQDVSTGLAAAGLRQGWHIVAADWKGSTVPSSVDKCDEGLGHYTVTED